MGKRIDKHGPKSSGRVQYVTTCHLTDRKTGVNYAVEVSFSYEKFIEYLSGRSSNNVFSKARRQGTATGVRLGGSLILDVSTEK